MSAMANATPLVTTVTKHATNPRDVDATPGLTSRNSVKSITRASYQLSWTKSAVTDGKMFILDWILRKRNLLAMHDQIPPPGTDSMDPPRGKSRPHSLDTSKEDRPKDRERFRSVEESYDDSFSHSYRDGNRSRHMKKRRDNESSPSSMSRKENPFTPRIRNFESSRRTRMPNNVKTYDGTGDPKDHVKCFQAAAQVERWAMPTWCHMFNSTLIGAARVWFDELPPESIDSYKDLKAEFLAYFMQQKKYVKDPVKIHNIKQKDEETIEDFIERFKTMEEMMITSTAFIRGEAAAASKKKGHASWKAQDQSKRQNSDKRSDFRGHSKEGRGSNWFTPLQGRRKRFLRLKQFAASNNEAEYEALIASLRITARMGVKNVHVSVDSKLVDNQVLGTYVAKEDNMVKYLEIVKSLVSGFTTFSISQVPRSKNKKADALSKIASTSFAYLSKQILVEVLKAKSIKEKEVATVIEEDRPTWMTPIVDYLKEGTIPGDKKEARKLRLKARQYELMVGILYRRSFLTPWLRCVGPLQAEYVIREIHKGSCSMHAGPRSVVAKAIRLGYY
nr:reverse transcriptase domain-containing protein [Tanacetum cinerariifolium]